MHRRSYLRWLTAGAVGGLAGCQSGGTDDTPTGTSEADTPSSGTPTPTPTHTETPTRAARTETATEEPTATETEAGTAASVSTAVPGKVVAPDGHESDFFGSAIAVTDGWAFVGAPEESTVDSPAVGSVYAFERSGATWTYRATLAPDDGAESTGFGAALAADGDRLLVGADGDDDPSGMNSGSAYVFERSNGAWTQRAKLVAGDGDAKDHFGSAVALDGTTAVVGASYDDPNGETSGAAYVFERAGGGWTQRTKLVDPDGAAGDKFGFAVAVAGDRALVGATADDADDERTGSAVLFERSNGEWSHRRTFSPGSTGSASLFGHSLGLDEARVLVGAPSESRADGSATGAVYAFERTGTEWRRARLVPDDGAADGFGSTLTLAGGRALVGAFATEDPNGFWGGAAYTFERADGEWTQSTKLVPDDGDSQDMFGEAVALSGDRAVVGAPWDEDPHGSSAGSAYVFSLDG